MDLRDAVDLVAEKLHPDGVIVGVGQADLHGVAPDTEAVAVKVQIVALVLQLHQLAAQGVPVPGLAGAQGDHHIGVVDGVAQRVNTGHRGHDDHVTPLKEAGGGAVAQPVQFGVHIGIFFNIGIGGRNIGFRLIIIIVTDEELHGVVGEELPELRTELCRQGLVVGEHQGGPLQLLDHVGHDKGLAGAGNAQHGLLFDPQTGALHQLANGLRLTAGRQIVAFQFELRHGCTSCAFCLNFNLYYTRTSVLLQAKQAANAAC